MKANLYHVAVIGAGIAGATIARCLSEQGIRVSVLEAGSSAASGASGNHQGAVYIKPGVTANAETALGYAALACAQACYARWQQESGVQFWHPTGLLQVALSDADNLRQQRIIQEQQPDPKLLQRVCSDEASALAGIAIPRGALWYPGSGWVRPDRLCATLLQAPGVTLKTGVCVTTLTEQEHQGGWTLLLDQGDLLHADAVVVCAGNASSDLLPCPLPLKPIRGQVSLLPGNSSMAPAVVVCGDGYVNPPCDDWQLIGASFDLDDMDKDIRHSSHQDNLQRIAAWLPQLSQQWPETETWQGRTSFRATTPDYNPIAGPLWQDQALVQRLRRNARIKGISGETLLDTPGLYTLTGLGSKG
ncbi:MAG: FAD-dependent oxidoreductase, partial [Halomonadaceae bacterium]